jgi:hypothetical protein
MEAKTEADGQAAASVDAVKKQIYHLKGPDWRSRLHSGSKNIGVPDLYLHRANIAEDDISESAVKNGFSIPQMVGNETFSAHDMIFDRLKTKGLLTQIGSLFHEITLRRDDICNHRNAAAPSTSRPLQRVTLNEVKLAAYVKELADPSVPLKKLARSVPHGYRGERMLDMLWNGGNLTQAMAAIRAQTASSANGSASIASRSVTIERAVWFVRVAGSSELSSSRARQSNGSTYTVEWTAVAMGWLRRQIVELNVLQSSVATPSTPSSPAAATNGRTAGLAATKQVLPTTPHHDGHYSLLLDDDFRSRWVAKWHYSIMLLRGMCHEHLVDAQAVIRSALDMLRTANVAQVSFALALVEEFLEAIYSSAALVDNALDTLCAKLVDLSSILEDGKFGAGICKELESTIVGIATRVPDALVNPSRWRKHRDFLTRLMQSTFSQEVSASISQRNERLLCALVDQRQLDLAASDQQTDVAILDRIAVDLTADDAFAELFRSSRHSSSSSEKLRSILIWSTTDWRSGSHRPFAGAQLLHLFTTTKDSRTKRHGKAALSLQKIDMGTFLLKWISEVEAAMQQSEQQEQSTSRVAMTAIQSVNVASLIVLIGETIRLGTFSYSKYLQRLTARGLTAAQSRDDKIGTGEYLHAKVMRSVPLSSASVSLEYQRRMAIYGNRTKESWEEAMQRRASKEAANAFAWSPSSTSSLIQWNADEELRHFWSSSRFVQHRVIQSHFMPFFRQQGARLGALAPSCFVHLCQLLTKADDFVSLCEILVILFDRREQVGSLLISLCVDAAIEHRIVWISMGMPLLEQLGVSLFPSHKVVKRILEVYHTESDLAITLQESAMTFLQGNYDHASSLLAKVAEQSHASTGTVASSAFFACAAVLREIEQQRDAVPAMIDWLKLVPAAIGTTWDAKWQEAVYDSLLSSEEGHKGVVLLLVHLLHCDLIKAVDLLCQYIVPCLEQATLSSASNDQPSIQIALDLLRALLLNDVDEGDPILLARLRSTRSTLIVMDTIKEILSVIASLALLEGQDPAGKVTSIKQAISRQCLVQLHFQTGLPELCLYLEERLRGDQLSSTVADLLATQSTLLLLNVLEIDYQRIIQDTSDWLSQQRLFELSVMVYRLDSIESGQQNRGQAKIQTIARLCVERWFKVGTMKKYGLSLVTHSRRASFAVAVNEELLKRIQSALGQGASVDVMETIQCALHLLRSSSKSALPSLTVASSLFSSIGERLASMKDSWEEEAEESPGREEQLGLQLAALCLLFRFDNIWTSPTKATALQLVYALLTQAVKLSCQGQARDVVVHQILDITAYCLQELPSDVRLAVQNMADTVVIMVQQAMPTDFVASRILFLFNRLPSSANITAPSMVMATTGGAAFISGRLQSVVEKPWDLHNNVEALDYYLQHQQQQQPNDNEVDSTFSPLVNNGPLSLELFSAKKTRDRLPLADVPIDSEVSYGLGWGGEPLIARDVRRGLLNLERDELIHRTPKEEIDEETIDSKVGKNIAKPSTTASKKRNEPVGASSSGQAAAAAAPKKKARKR